MKSSLKMILTLFAVFMLLFTLAVPAFADETAASETSAAETVTESQDNTSSAKAIAAGIAIAVSAGAGAIAMGIAIAKAVEGIARQPEAQSKIQTMLMLGLVFVETAIIYALVVAILIIFVL